MNKFTLSSSLYQQGSKLKKYFFIIFISFTLCLFCEQNQTTTPSTLSRDVSSNIAFDNKTSVDDSSVENSDSYDFPYIPNPTDELFINSWRPRNVSRSMIDDKRFEITNFAVGKQQFIEHETITLSFDRPRDADFVEILRCKHDLKIDAGISYLNFADIGISGLPQSEKDRLYRSSNIFNNAKDTIGCELINERSIDEKVSDLWCPSGTYRYLITACVLENRLIKEEGYTTRNCSKRFSVSSEVSYENKRKDKVKESLKETSVYSSMLDQKALEASNIGNDLIEAIRDCEKREHQRAVDKAFKDAVIQIVASVVEIALEIKTVQKAPGTSTWAHYTKRGEWMDKLQMIQAFAGFSFAMMFQTIMTGSEDMPRTCERSMELREKLSLSLENILTTGIWYNYYKERALLIENDMLDSADEQFLNPENLQFYMDPDIDDSNSPD